MTPPTPTAWIAALRSGTYAQGTNFLRDFNDKFCCLGVACDLAQVPVQRDRDSYKFDFGKCGLISMPSIKFCRDLGLNPTQAGEIARLNDDGKTFTQIADLLTFFYWAEGQHKY